MDNRGEPLATIRDEDACINFNFRADRARQITRCLARKSELHRRRMAASCRTPKISTQRFPRERSPKPALRLHDRYDKQFTLPVVVPPEALTNILANVMANLHLRNLRVAETEKYAHVTYFFNGGVEQPFPGEDRVLVPSPKVATYDLKPEMTASGIADAVVKAIERQRLRRDRRQLRQRRHGGPLRQDSADHQGGRDRGRLPGPHLRGRAPAAAAP